MNMVALIPARAGSKRIKGKNTRLLAGEPLTAHTIAAANASGVFARVLVSTDSRDVVRLCDELHCDVHIRGGVSGDDEPDIVWVRKALTFVGPHMNAFAILRPTAPFRTAATIQRAYEQFMHDEAHSLRAVQPVKEHPYKMWTCAGPGYPLNAAFVGANEYAGGDIQPWHSCPTQSLRPFYIQNASLEMAWSYVVTSFGTISGNKVAPFFTEGYEGFDLNTEDDWQMAERLLAEGKIALPTLARV